MVFATLLTAATPTTAPAAILLSRAVIVFLSAEYLFGQIVIVIIVDNWFEFRSFGGARASAGNRHFRAFVFAFGNYLYTHTVTLFDLDQIVTLRIEQIDGCFGAGSKADNRAFALRSFIFDQAQRGKPRTGCCANQTGTITMRAFASGRFQHACAQALAAHLHQTEAGNATNLNPRTIVFERVFHRAFDFADIGIVFHVDEVNHDKSGHIAQAKLTCDLARCLDIRRDSGLFNAVLFG